MAVSDAGDDWIDHTMDDSIEETTIPGIPYPLGSKNTLYIPEFVTQHVHDNMTEEEMLAAHGLFLKKDWLTAGLTSEIHSHFPQNEDICAETGQRSMESFKDHCLNLFPVNRIFASSRQISQAAKEFCDAWGISSTCLGKKIVFFMGRVPRGINRKKLTWA
jgi:hypothetical protein